MSFRKSTKLADADPNQTFCILVTYDDPILQSIPELNICRQFNTHDERKAFIKSFKKSHMDKLKTEYPDCKWQFDIILFKSTSQQIRL